MDVNSELLKKLLSIVEKKIKEINKAIIASHEELEKVNEFDVLVSRIREDELCFADPKFNEELEMLVGEVVISDKDLLNDLLDTIEYLRFVAMSIEDNKFNSFSPEEIEQKQEVISSLLKIKQLSNEQKEEEKQKFTKSNSELTQCVALYDKLRKGKEGLIHLNTDFTYLLSLVKDENPQFIKEVLELVRQLTICIHKNIMEQINVDTLNDDLDEEELEDIEQEVIDEELISDLFSKYGFDFNVFTKKHKFILTSKCKLQRIEQVLETLVAYPEYSFVKAYQKNNEKALFLIFRYASKETLTYLVKDAKEKNVRLEDIFKVNGVYKRVSVSQQGGSTPGDPNPGGDEYLNGSFDHYKKNAKTFEMLSSKYKEKHGIDIDFYQEILLKSPVVFTYSPHLVTKNIQHMIDYGISLVMNGRLGLEPTSPTILGAGNFLKLSDVLIENGLYQYLIEYPSVIKDEPLLKIILFEKRNNNLRMNSKGQIRAIRRDRSKYDMTQVESLVNRDNINSLLIGLNLPDEFYSILEEIENYNKPVIKLTDDSTLNRFELDPQIKIDSIHYLINGVKVSRLKFIRVWSAIIYCGLDKIYPYSTLLLFALTYNSIYSDDDLNKIVEFVNQPEFGGVPSNGTRKSI